VDLGGRRRKKTQTYFCIDFVILKFGSFGVTTSRTEKLTKECAWKNGL